MTKIITVSNQKGGVAKTSTCLNLGNSFAIYKKKVLLIDFDVQSNLTLSLGYRNTSSLYEVIHSGLNSLSKILIKTRYPNLWLIPSNSNMALLNRQYFMMEDYEYILKEKLKEFKDQFDVILIDTPPSVGFFTVNALTTAEMIIIPSQCEYLSIVGVKETIKMINLVKQKTNPDVLFKILVIQYDGRPNISKYIYEKLKEVYKKELFNTVISLDTKLKESQVMGRPVVYYDKHSRAGIQYISLAKEILEGDSGA